MKVEKVIKRDGRLVDFEESKIENAIYKATAAVGPGDRKLAGRLASKASKLLEKGFKDKIPSVEDVQDVVEKVLIAEGCSDVAKAYILYRKKRAEIRGAKAAYGVYDELKLSVNAVKALKERYLRKDSSGRILETPSEMFKRLAKVVSSVDLGYGGDAKKTESGFYSLMSSLEFLPNSPALMNAGTGIGQLAACFVLPVDDSMESIFEAVKNAALIHQSGGGTGFSFSRLRPKGDVVKSTYGVASGPVSFMKVFNTATEVIRQGGRRRGANMGLLRVDHPDIMEFVTAKEHEGAFQNFNLSVGVTDGFMEAVRDDTEYELVNPRTGKCTRKIGARNVFDLIVAMAWKNGEPGLVFLDTVNKHNPTPEIGSLEATNPCGEVPLLPYESCNLGSINLSKMLDEGKVDWEKLEKTTRLAVHFLDNVIDANKYPIKSIEEATKANRKIGLGVMGFADMLLMLGMPYNSEKGRRLAEKVMGFIQKNADDESRRLAEERGEFPNSEKSIYSGEGMRNATRTAIAPTGSISLIADCSSGIEPIFAVSYVRRVLGGEMLEINPVFEEKARKKGFYTDGLMRKIALGGSIKGLDEVPEEYRKVFVTAHDITPKEHIMMQAAFQKHVNNSISKTINLAPDAGVADVEEAFLLAFELGCKGVTVYRHGSRREQVLDMVCSVCEV